MNGVAVHCDLSLIGHDCTGEHLDEARLAGTVVADHGEDLTPTQIEVCAVDRGDAAVTLDEAARLECQGLVACLFSQGCWLSQDCSPRYLAVLRRMNWSTATATITRTPVAIFWYRLSTLASVRTWPRPLTITAPTRVPSTPPRPPNRLVPPITTAVMVSKPAFW